MKLNMTSILLESVQKVNEDSHSISMKNLNSLNNYVLVNEEDEINMDDVNKEDNQNNKKEIEDRIAELRLALSDEAISDDEKVSVNAEIAELEDKLNENFAVGDSVKSDDEDYGVYFLGSTDRPSLLNKFKTGDIVYIDLGGGTFSDDYHIIGYASENQDGTGIPYYVLKRHDGFINIGDDSSLLSPNELDEYESDSAMFESTSKSKDNFSKTVSDALNFLIDDEKEAIEGYNKELEKIKKFSDKDVSKFIELFKHIIDEEKEHIEELTNAFDYDGGNE